MNGQAVKKVMQDQASGVEPRRPSLPVLDITALAAALARTYATRRQPHRRGRPHKV